MHVLSHLKQGLNSGTVGSHAATGSELIKCAFVVEHGSICDRRVGGGCGHDTEQGCDRPASIKTLQNTKIFRKKRKEKKSAFYCFLLRLVLTFFSLSPFAVNASPSVFKMTETSDLLGPTLPFKHRWTKKTNNYARISILAQIIIISQRASAARLVGSASRFAEKAFLR